MTKKKPSSVEAELVDEKPDPRSPSTALVHVANHAAVTLARDPNKILEEAGRAAKALMGVIKNQPDLSLKMGNGNHLRFEAWQTVGRFYNLVPKTRETKFVQFQRNGQEITGFQAYADVIDTVTGAVMSSAEALCLDEEEKWSTRPKYEYLIVGKDGQLYRDGTIAPRDMVWEKSDKPGGKDRPKKQRVQTEDVAVPLFQLLSMAQTRAESKALRNVLSSVVVMAGYSPTPAEEMETDRAPAEPERPPDSAYDNYGPYVDAEEPTRNKPAAKKAAAKKAAAPAAPPAGAVKQAAPAKPVPAAAPPPPPQAPPTPAAGSSGPKRITDAQQRRFWAIATQNKWTEKMVHSMVRRELKIDHVHEIPQGRANYDRIVDTILVSGPEAYFRGGAQ